MKKKKEITVGQMIGIFLIVFGGSIALSSFFPDVIQFSYMVQRVFAGMVFAVIGFIFIKSW